MKKQLIQLMVAAFIWGVSFNFSSAFADRQPGFSLVISPVIFHPMARPVMYQREVYFHNRYPRNEDHEVTYLKHIEPVHMHKFRNGHYHY